MNNQSEEQLKYYYEHVLRSGSNLSFDKLNPEQKNNLLQSVTYAEWCKRCKIRKDNLLRANATLQSNLGSDATKQEREDATSVWNFMLNIIRSFNPVMADGMVDESVKQD